MCRYVLIVQSGYIISKTLTGTYEGGYTYVFAMCFYRILDFVIYIYILQGVPGGKDLTSGECSLGQTIPI